MKYFLDSITSPAYWRYALFSGSGLRTVLAVFGSVWLFIEMLDFFGIYKRDDYASYAFIIVAAASLVIALLIRRPVRVITVTFPENDVCLEVRIGDMFEAIGAVMISSNTVFECDVAGGKISPQSLQGQFTAKYFTGDQNSLIKLVETELEEVGSPPYPIGTTIPIVTHGKTFYFVAMAEMNEHGNASTDLKSVQEALEGLWQKVRESGELQELVVPVIGSARGRLKLPRKKIIEEIAESFVDASREGRFTDRLVIVVHPSDAKNFEINLYDIKDHLKHALVGAN